MTIVPTTMAAVLLTGHGGLDKLVYSSDVPVPEPGARRGAGRASRPAA